MSVRAGRLTLRAVKQPPRPEVYQKSFLPGGVGFLVQPCLPGDVMPCPDAIALSCCLAAHFLRPSRVERDDPRNSISLYIPRARAVQLLIDRGACFSALYQVPHHRATSVPLDLDTWHQPPLSRDVSGLLEGSWGVGPEKPPGPFGQQEAQSSG